VSAAAPAPNTEAQQAAVSPIHRARDTGRETSTAAAPAVAHQPTQAAVTSPAPTVSSATERAKAGPKVAPAATSSTQPAVGAVAAAAAATPNAEADKPARAVNRHVSRPRPERSAESDTTTTKPAAANRAGSTEVQMF
jgi:hypothetical protein